MLLFQGRSNSGPASSIRATSVIPTSSFMKGDDPCEMRDGIYPPLSSANQYPSLILLQKCLLTGKELPFWNT